MSLGAGVSIGRYEISARLGAGGMGEVYRARDPRIGRDVALKILPQAFATDAERLRRFEQEARSTGQLNHPNILTLYDIGTISSKGDVRLAPIEGAPYLVAELLEGQTLRDELKGRALPLEKALSCARQILAGLAAAHEKGIVHRDLKPENLFVTESGVVKILDFGLAKPTWTEGAGGISNDEPTALATESGLILGTAAYMSPEQVRAGSVDARSDLFAFGTILFEMLTGERPFRRETTAETMSAILNDPAPSLSAIQPELPPSLERFLGHCLEKSAARRFQSASDAAYALETLNDSASSAPATATATRRPSSVRPMRLWLVLGGAALALAVAGVAIGRWRARPEPKPATAPARVSPLITGEALERLPAWSPAGNLIAYVSDEAGNDDVWISDPTGTNRIDLTADFLGADSAPAWSPDGQQIAFLSERDGGGIFVMSALGGAARKVVPLASIGFDTRGLTWAKDGSLIYSSRDSAGRKQVYRFVFSTGEPGCLTCGLEGHQTARAGELSPSGGLLAFLSAYSGWGAELFVLELASGRVHSIANWVDEPHWSVQGDRLVMVSARDGITDLWQIAVDPVTGQKTGEMERVTSGLGASTFALSPDGRAIVAERDASSSSLWSRAASTKKVTSLDAGERLTRSRFSDGRPRWAPDGRAIFFESDRRGSLDIWRLDAGASDPVRLTSGEGTENRPRPNPTGKWLAFDVGGADGSPQVHFMRPDGSEQHLASPNWPGRFRSTCCSSWSPDGKKLVMFVETKERQFVTGFSDVDVSTGTILATEIRDLPGESECQHRWSGDGRWIVYEGLSENNWNLFLTDLEGQWAHQLTRAPGNERFAVWQPDGRAVLYVKNDKNVWRQRVTAAGEPLGEAEPWIELPGRLAISLDSLDFSPDGSRLVTSVFEPASDLWLVERQP